MVKFRYVSDTHLELLSKVPVLVNLDYENETLLLLGDIGYPASKIYKQFIKNCSKDWKNVFVLFGNHEYYNDDYRQTYTMDDIEQNIKHFPPNVHFLNNSFKYLSSSNDVFDNIKDDIKNDNSKNDNSTKKYIKIVGSTLWSDIETHVYLNDNNNIHVTQGSKFSHAMCRILFYSSRKYILQEIDRESDIKCVLITHHGTHSLCNGEYYKDSPNVSGFITDIPELACKTNLIACINGHTHANINTYIPGTNIQLLANCMGYKQEKNNIKYDKHAILEVLT